MFVIKASGKIYIVLWGFLWGKLMCAFMYLGPRKIEVFRVIWAKIYLSYPTFTLAYHYKLDKVLLIFGVVFVYISGEGITK